MDVSSSPPAAVPFAGPGVFPRRLRLVPRGVASPDGDKEGEMSIVNRRNAMVGWAVWTVGKQLAKRKAKAAVPAIDAKTKRPNRAAMALAAAVAVGGAMLFWRSRDGGDGGDVVG
jgi:hypothetical protein